MNIETIAENLRNTIAGKERLLANTQRALRLSTSAECISLSATIGFLKINIAELKNILQDVEQCSEEFGRGYEQAMLTLRS